MRQPLAIATSRGGGADQAYRGVGVLKTSADPSPAPDTRSYGNVGFSYPSAVQVGGRLVVAYSEDKENIWVSVVEVADLP